ncbi:MAG: hypothetical protein Q9182_004131 [Xanthomendoza sp. 2 TL-2023]
MTFGEGANKIGVVMEQSYDRPMGKAHRTEEQIARNASLPPTSENTEALYLASVEEMMTTRSGACPRKKTLRQRATYFKDLRFTTFEGLLMQAGTSRRGSGGQS